MKKIGTASNSTVFIRSNIRKTLQFFFFSLLFLSLNHCKSREEEPQTPDCGCESKVLKTIPESANLIATIGYKVQISPDDNYYNNKFWITYTERNCSNCVHHMIVCNESLLPREVLDLKKTGGNLSVKFSGQLKEICEKIFSPADITYEHITLTKIEVQ